MDFRLFISHSSPIEESITRLRALQAEIERVARETAPVRVLVDMDQIVGADDWRQRIAYLLHACHGGIVLIDEASLSSKWVLAEAAFLSLRHLANDSFPFIPVSFLDQPDLERAKKARAEQYRFLNDTAWDVVSLPDVQYVHGRTPEEVANGIVTALRAKSALRPMSSPADRLADQLTPLFKAAGEQVLRELADELDGASGYESGSDEARAAMVIVRHMLGCGRLTQTMRQMDRLGSAFPDEHRRKILDELSPLPLPADGAAMLTRRRDSGGYAHALLRTEMPSFTVPLYVRRAHLTFRPPKFFAIANNVGSFDDLSANIRQEWRSMRGSSLSDDGVDARLNSDDLDLYVWVPGPVDTGVLDQLERAYPRIAFIIHYADGSSPAALPPGVLPVTPALDPAEEDAICIDYDRAMTFLAD